MPYFLALDAGGTKTDYLLADETRELARARSGSIKRMRVDAATATANLETALAELTRLSGIPMRSITCTCIGTAGNTVPLVTDWLREAFDARVSGSLLILGDVEIALDAAFHGSPGVLVLAGTGSNVAGRDAHGKLTTAGGWGPTLADQGSGHRIGLRALRAAFLTLDENPSYSNPLLSAILNHWNLASIDALVEFANRIPTPDVSTLTTLVHRCAIEEDPIARSILRREGEELAHLVLLVLHRLQAAAPGAPLPSIAFAGSVMEKVHPVRYALIAAVRREFPSIQTQDGADPIQGALWRARGAIDPQKALTPS